MLVVDSRAEVAGRNADLEAQKLERQSLAELRAAFAGRTLAGAPAASWAEKSMGTPKKLAEAVARHSALLGPKLNEFGYDPRTHPEARKLFDHLADEQLAVLAASKAPLPSTPQ